MLHNALLVAAENEEILGVAGQKIHYRTRPKKENAAQRLKRERESKVWGDLIDDVGSPPDGTQFVHVCDRGADGFEVYCHLVDEPGWITIWRGWEKLNTLVRGAELALRFKSELEKCG